jgi:ATP-dependent RNA helicase DHX8/PRP22
MDQHRREDMPIAEKEKDMFSDSEQPSTVGSLSDRIMVPDSVSPAVDSSEDHLKHSYEGLLKTGGEAKQEKSKVKKHGSTGRLSSRGGKKPTVTSQADIDNIVAKKLINATSKPKRRNRSKSGRKGTKISENKNEEVVIVQSHPPLLEEISLQNWESHFKEFLPEMSDVSYFNPEGKEELHIRVSFNSSSSALKAVSTLNNKFICEIHKLSLHLETPEEITVPQAVSVGDTSKPAVDFEMDRNCLAKDISRRMQECAAKRRKDISKLEKTLSNEVKAASNIEKLVEERNKKLKFSTEQCILRGEVFLSCCDQIRVKVAGHTEKEHCDVDSLRACFNREVTRHKRKLPIYAHRLVILEMIEKHQVCVIAGETGAGKSTQLVQYLNEAGYATNLGVIACTQPGTAAAISLAEHVSAEVNEDVGATYGYIAAARSRKGDSTKVLYMRDHSLLSECLVDPTLSKYSCVVIDEAQERSIYTDVLIAFIKCCFPSRQDLKVIIVSSTNNPTLFSSFFGGPSLCPIMEIPYWTYPVEVTWKKHEELTADRDYVSDAVNMVCDIHAQGEPGDVLVFLTCPAETERACEIARDSLKNEAVVFPLHDKMHPEDRNKIFTSTEKGKRKVVFSTNLAESAVTIPSIVYVVDTGVSRELSHDPITNMSTFEIQPISKSSADQRKHRAGRTSHGECYRLYSMADYADMEDNSTAEILCISLASVVAKLYKFGIKDIYSFDFMESPSNKALGLAVEDLNFLGAIKDGELTALGEKMAFLPLDPALAKVLLDGINHGVGTTAAVAVAISSLVGSVFFSSYSVEFQRAKMVLPFSQQSGDQMTYLHAYFEWFQHERKKNAKWGLENCINANSMLIVKQTVEELRFALKQIDTKIPGELTPNSLSKADRILPKLFFEAFIRNICVHLGHPQAWYWSEKFPDERLVGFSLQYLSSTPKCIIYEKTEKTSQHFLLHALTVCEEWIQEALASGKLQCHPAESSWFQRYCVSPLVFTNLGGTVMSELLQKCQNVKIFNCEVQPVLEHNKHHGILRIFAQKEHHNHIDRMINHYASSVRAELKAETYERSMRKLDNDVVVVIGAGACIQNVLISSDYQAVVVRGLSQTLVPIVENELKQYGQCETSTSLRMNREQGILLYVGYKNSLDAAKALRHTFRVPGLRVSRHLGFNNYPSSFTVKWRKLQKKEAYAQFFDSHIVDYLSNCSIVSDTESGLLFNPTRKKGVILISGIRKNMTDEEIRQRLIVNFPSCLKDAEVSIVNVAGKSYSKHNTPLDGLLAEFANEHDYTIKFHRPKLNNEASFSFEDSLLCCRLIRRLCGELTDGSIEGPSYSDSYKSLSDSEAKLLLSDLEVVDLSLFSSTRYNLQVFNVIRPSIQHVCDFFSASKFVEVKCDAVDRWEYGFVDITATDLGTFTEAKKMVAEAVAPASLSFSDSSTCQYLSTVNFQETMTDIQSQTSTYIELSAHHLSARVAIYGTKSRRERAKEEVELHLLNMEKKEVTWFEINLKERDLGLMKQLVGEYGSDVSKLPTAFEGIVAAKLNPRRQMLTLFATETGYESFLCSLAKFKAFPRSHNLSMLSTGTECHMCFETHDNYRLEYCGHVFCRECLGLQLEATSIEYPITCAADKCGKRLVWKDFENLLLGDFHDFVTASFKSYVKTNPDKISKCVTPGCDMVYYVSGNGKRIICRHCRASVCSQCNTTWHDGFDSCEAYRASRDDAEVKPCPEGAVAA